MKEIRPEAITPEMVALWKIIQEIIDADEDKRWEEDPLPGRAGAFHTACVALQAKLGLRPWEADPIFAGNPDPPDWMDAEERVVYTTKSHPLFVALDRASGRDMWEDDA